MAIEGQVMYVGSITPYYQGCFSRQNPNYRNKVALTPRIQQLSADTVSFSGNITTPLSRIEEAIRLGYDKNLPFYRSMGARLMDTLKVIADKYASRGVSFDEAYCAPAVVKSTDSFISKFLRCGESLDRVRSTLFVENPYDFKLIREILDDFELRGYFVRQIPQGKKSSIPDFDIRLDGVKPEDTVILGEDLAKCIGKPQKSGYEDIQIRLVDKNLSKKDAPPLEVLILYGKNYAIAKHNESYYSYDIRRMLDNLLHISKIENPNVHTPAYRVKTNTDTIGGILRDYIAKPLFFNAKNKDYFHESLKRPTELSQENCAVLRGLLNGIENKISLHYRMESAKVRASEYVPELEKLIQESEDYIERDDKTIYIADIRKMRKTLLEKIRLEKQEDLSIVANVKKRLNETIEKYGQKD